MREAVNAIVGLSKNSGKTSFLNWFIKNNEFGSVAITTTGRDGEDIDLVTNLQKPKVILPKGVYFTAFDYSFSKNSYSVKGIEKLPYRVIGKNLWLCKSLESIETEVVGPTTLKEQEHLITVLKDYGCETIFIDGSLDRKSICLSEKIANIILVVGAATGNINEIREQSEKIKLYEDFQKVETEKYEHITYASNDKIIDTNIKSVYSNETSIIDILKENPEWIYFSGAMTEQSWQKLKNPLLSFSGKVVFSSPLSVRIGNDELKRFIKEKSLYSRTRFPLSAIAVNSFSPYNAHIDADLLRKEIKKIFPNKPVYDVTETY